MSTRDSLDLWIWTVSDDTDGWCVLEGQAEWRSGHDAVAPQRLAQWQALREFCHAQFGPPGDEETDGWALSEQGLAGMTPSSSGDGTWESAQIVLRLSPDQWQALELAFDFGESEEA